MQFFKGATQTRCRITPYPVVTPDRISERMPGYTYFDNLKTRWQYQREYGWAEYINFVRNDTLKYFDIDGLFCLPTPHVLSPRAPATPFSET